MTGDVVRKDQVIKVEVVGTETSTATLHAVWGFTPLPWSNSPLMHVVQSCDRPVTDVCVCTAYVPAEPKNGRVQFSFLWTAVYMHQAHRVTWPHTWGVRTIKDFLKNWCTTLNHYISMDAVISLWIFCITLSMDRGDGIYVGCNILFLSQQTLQPLFKSCLLLFGERGVHLGLHPSLGEARPFMFYNFF